MSKTYRVSIEVEVHDETELFHAAVARAQAEGQSIECAHELLGSPDEVNVEACLCVLLDNPASMEDSGSQIEQSSCEFMCGDEAEREVFYMR